MAFIDALIEGYADEWLTKAMYHYRWAYQADIDKAGRLLPISQSLQLGNDQQQQEMYGYITGRQIGRRALVGSTDENAPIIEESYERLLDTLTHLYASHDFLCGERPGRGDFGL